MFKKIDNLINSITMYRLLLWGLLAMAFISIALGFFGILPFGGLPYIYSMLLLTVVCYSSNLLFSKIFKAPVNVESSWITAFILFFIMFPVTNLNDALTLIIVGLVAMASKYIVAINKKHIFNPAAFGALVLGLFGNPNVTWWVGSEAMLPYVIILGILILRKTRRFQLFFWFLGASALTLAITNPETIIQNLLSYPLIFFGTIMLTEPLTTPPRSKHRAIYGSATGLLISIPFHFGFLYSTPEFALAVGNLFSYFVSLKKRLILKLIERKQIARDIYEFSFGNKENEPAIDFGDLPGQYLEWTLPHPNSDSRGVRRYFSIASGFDEANLKIGVKIVGKSSSFKKHMLSMKNGDSIAVGALSGDFVLPKDTGQKLAFIAGGIGVTPFRSMVKYILNEEKETNKKRDVILFYAVKSEEEIAYKEVFNSIKTHYLVNQFLTEEIVKEEVPDFKERRFYISGPNAMVENYAKMLRGMGVKNKDIITDYFPGY